VVLKVAVQFSLYWLSVVGSKLWFDEYPDCGASPSWGESVELNEWQAGNNAASTETTDENLIFS
jgi:hypothetical protein